MVRGSVYFVNCSVVLAVVALLEQSAFATSASYRVREWKSRFDESLHECRIYNSVCNLHILLRCSDVRHENWIVRNRNAHKCLFCVENCEYSFETLCATELTFWSDSATLKCKKAQNECTNDEDKTKKKIKRNLQQRNPLAMTLRRYGCFTA